MDSELFLHICKMQNAKKNKNIGRFRQIILTQFNEQLIKKDII